MRRFLLRIIFNALALYIVVSVVPGVVFRADWKMYLLSGLIFALINTLVRPVLKLISFPFLVLTFGLFTFVINMGLLWILAQIVSNFYLANFWSYFWATVILSILNFLVSPFFKNRKLATK